MELGRRVAVIALVTEQSDKRGLRIAPRPCADARDLAQARPASVRGDDERGTNGLIILDVDHGAIAGDAIAEGLLRKGRIVVVGRRGHGQVRDENAVLDVPAERVEADLGGGERDRRQAKQAARVVDDLHHGHRARVALDRFPDAEGPEQADGSVEQGDRAAVAARLGMTDQRGLKAFAHEGEGGGETDRAGADDGDVEVATLRRHDSASWWPTAMRASAMLGA